MAEIACKGTCSKWPDLKFFEMFLNLKGEAKLELEGKKLAMVVQKIAEINPNYAEVATNGPQKWPDLKFFEMVYN